MAEAWQSAWVEVLPDFKNFKKRANSEITSSLGAAGREGGHSFRTGFGSVLGGVLGANILTGIGFAIGRKINDAIVAGLSFTTTGVGFASSLGEQVNAVRVAFGDMGDEILEISKDAPRNLNLTRAAFDKIAVRFSSFATTISRRGGSSADVIAELTRRGADFASVYDIDVNEALELFQSGLAGETEPLRRFGLDLSAAAVQSYAYANGITEVGAQLTESEKIQARYGALLEQTAKTEGDLANTRGSFANQQRELNVALEEAQTSFGEALLPTALDLVSFANRDLIPMLNEALGDAGPVLADSISDAMPEIKETLATAAEALPDAIEALGGIAGILADSAQGDLGEGGVVAGTIDLFNLDADEIDKAANDGITTFIDAMAGDTRAQEALGDWWDAAWFGAGVHNERVAKEQADKLAGAFAGQFATADAWDRALDPIDKLGLDVAAAGSEAMDALTLALASGKPSAVAEALGLKLGITGHIKQLGIDSGPLGTQFIDGLTASLLAGRTKVGLAGAAVARAAVTAVRKTLDSHSPSRVMFAEGVNAIDGLIGGWESKSLAPVAVPRVSSSAASGSSVPGAGLVVSVQSKGGIDILKYVDVRVEQGSADRALDMQTGGVA